jgi:hypothetical protein
MSLKNIEGWKKFEKSALERIKQSGEIKNLELASELWRILMEDQGIRSIASIMRSNEKDSDIAKLSLNSLVYPLMREIDGKNTARVKKIIEEEYLEIEQDTIGKTAVGTIFLVIQHFGDIDLMKTFLPILEKICKKNDDWDRYMLLYDRIQMVEGKKQLYGTQLTLDDQSKNWISYPIEDEEKVNIRRYEKGNYMPVERYVHGIR